MLTLLKYWPVIGTMIGLGANGFMFWFIWSMRQWMRNEVEQLLAAEVTRLEKADVGTAEAVDLLDTRMTKMEGAVGGIRSDIAKLPTKADLARVEGEIKVVAGGVEAAGAGITRIESFFLARGVERT